jgi:7-carboxy-7-deazaguanine synthase
MEERSMKVYRIFVSVDGEVNYYHQGCLSIFIRLAGCNLNCLYCDTRYAMDQRKAMDLTPGEVFAKIKTASPIRKVTITGGEPLLQLSELQILVRMLSEKGYRISIETNGSKICGLAYVQSFVVDYKLPSSGQEGFMLPIELFATLRESDWIKFVVQDRADFDRAVSLVKILGDLHALAGIAFSPVLGALPPKVLIDWMVERNLDGPVLNIQLHKIIGLVEDK